jgi:cytochrome c oxidase subunit 1
MTDSPPPVANFHTPPVFTRGPYDYHLATPEELATGEDGRELPMTGRKESAPAA